MFQPNSRGIIQPVKQTIRYGGHCTSYTKPNNSLNRINRLMNGEKPCLAITRKQGGLGDVLMTLPTVKAISQKYNIKIDYGTDFNYLDGALYKVLEGNPYINQVKLWKEVKIENYDGIIDLTCPCVAYEQPLVPPINRIDLFARHASISLQDHNIDYYVKDKEIEWAKNYIIDNNLSRYKIILVQPFSSATHRDIPADKLKNALIKILQHDKQIRVILLTHYTDSSKHNWNINGIHIANNLFCREIAALITQSNLVVCPDSSILHLASALHHKTFTFFGPTDPRARVNYHPEAVAYWPAKHLNNYPIWYSSSSDKYLCWKMMDQDVIAKSIYCMLYDESLPAIDDYITFGKH